MTEHAAAGGAIAGRGLGIVGGLMSAAQAIVLVVLFGPESGAAVDLANEAWTGLGEWGGEANPCGLLVFVAMAFALVVVVVLLALVMGLVVVLLGATYGAFLGRPRWLAGAAAANVIACGAWLCGVALVPEHAASAGALAGVALLAAVLCAISAVQMRKPANPR